MADFPTFFFSHARQDRSPLLLQFYEDLEKRVRDWTRNLEPHQQLGTIDNRIAQGDDWDENLSQGLSNNNTFIAIWSLNYFGRPNCGKELSVFLLRSPTLGIDRNGSLTGVKNVMPIRWQPEGAYEDNGTPNGQVPDILKLIEYMPAARPGNSDRTKAIERYRQKGMRRCVRATDYYDELLDAFAESIRDMAKLPSGPGVRFADAFDAFDYDWFKHFNVQPPTWAPAPTVTQPPTALSSIVAFYVTRRHTQKYPAAVDFADYLIAESPTGEAARTDPTLSALLADVRAAGLAEGFSVYQAATDPAVPSAPAALLRYLVRLSKDRIFPVVVVDPSIESDGWQITERDALKEILRSPDWSGLVVTPTMEGNVPRIADFITASEMKTPILAVPENSAERVAELSRAFFRFRALSTASTNGGSEGERPPMLQGPRAE